jgi:hypothetical protein
MENCRDELSIDFRIDCPSSETLGMGTPHGDRRAFPLYLRRGAWVWTWNVGMRSRKKWKKKFHPVISLFMEEVREDKLDVVPLYFEG